MRAYTLFLLRFRLPLSIALAALLAASLAALPHVRLDFSLIPLLEGDAEARRRVEDFYDLLPPRQADFTLALTWPEEIGAAELTFVEALAAELEALTHVEEVLALTRARVVEGLGPIPLVLPFPDLVGDGSALDVARDHPLLLGSLLSRDGRSTVIIINTDWELGDAGRLDLLEEIETFLRDRIPPPVASRLLGGSVVQRAMTRHIRRDMLRSVMLEALVFSILLPLLFRSWRGMLLPLAAVNAGVAFNFGLLVAAGRSITSLEIALPGLIVVIALCDSIHLLHRFEESFRVHADRRRAILDMMEHVGRACLYTSVTTSMGFLSLLIARHAAVREFALSASVAVVVAFLSVITLLPLMLAWWPVRRPTAEGLAFLDRLGVGRRGVTIAVFGAALLVCGLGISRIVVDATWLGELPRRDPAIEDLAWYEAHFNGLLTLEVELEGPLDTPEAFAAIEALRARTLARPGVTGADAYTDWVREMAGNPGVMTPALIERGIARLRLAGPDFPRQAVTPDFRSGRLLFMTGDLGIRRYLELQAEIEADAASLPESIRAKAGGYSKMAYESSQLVVTTMLQSLGISLLAISVFLGLVFRSWRLGVISILPNALPILMALGMTGWLGIPLRIGIVMVYCLGVGLAVDDTIHLFARFTAERAAGGAEPLRSLIERCLRTTGKALVITSAVLTVGALTYLPSAFRSIRDVGILMAVIIVTALAADLFVVPLLLEAVFKEKTAPGTDRREPGEQSAPE